MATAEPSRQFRADPYPYRRARALVEGLGVSEPVAVTLVRRGLDTVEDARAFLEASERHDPFALSGMEEACAGLLAAVTAGERITVHGDYDVDGVCATAILVSALRELGAVCDWFIPDRAGEGYGLVPQTVERLAARGTDHLVTVDCGITAAREVELAREAGMRVLVTDHHEPGPELPPCPVLHPRLGEYPFGELCGAAVAWKLASALRARAGVDPARAEEDLDLVALATVADLVALRGENRALVRAGLRVARRAGRPGLRALCVVAGVEPSRIDERALAFRLAPRVNAAGRLYRADAGVELMLSAEEGRTREIAEELDRANAERRAVERELLRSVHAVRAELPPEEAEGPALVLAGEGWHPGVIGIVASRLVEELWRPVVLIGLEGGLGRGSGRSVPGLDLAAAFAACGAHLERHGGHSAAAGLEIRHDRVAGFRRALGEHVAGALRPEDMVRTQHVDALVGSDGLGLGLCEELERLGPFGQGNPGVSLLVPGATIDDVRPMGEERRHARFSLISGGARARGVGFGTGTALPAGEPLDVAVRLEANEWNGTVEPRAVLRELYPVPDGAPAPALAERAGPEEWWGRALASREAGVSGCPLLEAATAGSQRTEIRRHGRSAVAAIAELLSTGEPVVAVCADASRRRALAVLSAAPLRFGSGEARVACGRTAAAEVEALCSSQRGNPRLVLCDWALLERHPDLALGAEHLVCVDPPPSPGLRALAAGGGGFLHLAWSSVEIELARRVHAAAWDLRPSLGELWGALRSAGGKLAGARLHEALAGPGPHPRLPEPAGLCLRVLEELELCEVACDRPIPVLRSVSSEKTELERSETFRATAERLLEGDRFLTGQTPRP